MEDLRLFSILDENSKVINLVVFPKNPEPFTFSEEIDGNQVEKTIIPQPESILESYPQSCSILEYSRDVSITNNQANIGDTYNIQLNAFIPPKPNETYILNEDTFVWEPNQELEYELHGDGNIYKWIRTGWILKT
jgi:hypothetical protein